MATEASPGPISSALAGFVRRVEKGGATLNGEVEWYFQKEAAGQPVRTLIGVAGVSNLIEIKPTADADDISQRPHGPGI